MSTSDTFRWVTAARVLALALAMSALAVVIVLIPRPAAAANPNLRYFGYYGSSIAGQHFVDGYKDHANVALVEPTLTAISLQKSRGVLAIVEIGTLFFEPGGPGCGRQDPYRLRSDFPAWTALRNQIVAAGLQSTVLGFYNMDTPLNHCVNRDSLEYVGGIVKASFPGKKLMVTYGAPTVSSGMNLPRNHDWFSFTCYADLADCGSGFQNMFNVVKGKLLPGQQIIVTAQGFIDPVIGSPTSSPCPPTNAKQNILAARADQFLNKAQDPVVAGLMVFLWPSPKFVLGSTGCGVKDMPIVQAKYRSIGKAITGK